MRGVKNKFRIIIAILAVALICLAAYLLANREAENRATLSCSEGGAVFSEINGMISPNADYTNSELTNLISQIESTNNYVDDYDCVYPLAVFYAKTENPENLRSSYDRLVILSDNGQSLSSEWRYRLDIADFATYLDFYDSAAELTDQNAIYPDYNGGEGDSQ